MKNVYKYALIASASLSLAACNNLIEPSETVDIERTITLIATREGTDPNTRSVRMEDGTTWWSPREEISVFYGSGSNGGSKFTSNNTTLSETAEFEGSISMSGNKEFWAVYPYSAENTCDGNSITTVIPSEQTGVEGNFSNDAFPAMGKSSSLTMPFYNICGGLKIIVSRSDIKTISIKGNKDEAIAGKVKVTFGDSGTPVISEVLNPETSITLTAPDGGFFEAGESYYVTVLPTVLSEGFSITYETDQHIGTFKSDRSQEVKRSVFGVLKNLEERIENWKYIYGYDCVDLGLSVKWATYNVGASKPEEYGDYYAWGETEPYYEPGYAQSPAPVWKSGKEGGYSEESYSFSDNPNQLSSANDAATVNWGSDWRMPTKSEAQELTNPAYCRWTKTTRNGVSGYLVTSRIPGYTNNAVFLPDAGQRSYSGFWPEFGEAGYYWTSSLCSWGTECADYFYGCGNDDNEEYVSAPIMPVYAMCNSDNRFFGLPVRPVYNVADDTSPKVTRVLLNKSEVSLYGGEEIQLTATILPLSASSSITWTSSNSSIAEVGSSGYVFAKKAGSCTITAVANSGGISAHCRVTVNDSYEQEAVDLGLSVKWGTLNLGAAAPERAGHYFAWGASRTYYYPDYGCWYDYYGVADWVFFWNDGKESGYSPDSYLSKRLDKYKGRTRFANSNYVVLDFCDDAVYWFEGPNWRIPTTDEFNELMNLCEWTWTTENGVEGYRITSYMDGYTDKSIFLPVTGMMDGTNLYGYYPTLSGGMEGYCYYWTSTASCDWDSVTPSFMGGGGGSPGLASANSMPSLYSGLAIRPVYSNVTGVTLDITELTLSPGRSATITPKLTPLSARTAKNTNVTWSSNDNSIATVDGIGVVTARAPGKCIITVKTNDGGLTASCTVTVTPKPEMTVGEFVDLGLSVNWATYNLGATRPEEYGDYYAWGEVTPMYYDDSKWHPYVYDDYGSGGLNYDSFLKYSYSDHYWYPDDPQSYYGLYYYHPCSVISYTNGNKEVYNEHYYTDAAIFNGDNKLFLNPEDDAATVNWGAFWRMPTKSEWIELRNNCKWEWININEGSDQDELYGYRVTSKIEGYSDRFIFLPAGGQLEGGSYRPNGTSTCYWSSSLYYSARSSWVDCGGYSLDGMSISSEERNAFLSIRPVCPKE